MVKKIFAFLLLCITLFSGYLIVQTLRFTSRQRAVKVLHAPSLSQSSIQNFQKAVGFKTVSYQDSSLLDTAQFMGFQRFLEKAYPLLHRRLSREPVNTYTLLFHWKGKEAALPPAILMAHMDVVPVEEASLPLWKVDPFAGVIKDGYIWGRGAWDNKINLISIMAKKKVFYIL